MTPEIKAALELIKLLEPSKEALKELILLGELSSFEEYVKCRAKYQTLVEIEERVREYVNALRKAEIGDDAEDE